jgi:hypothetical protein
MMCFQQGQHPKQYCKEGADGVHGEPSCVGFKSECPLPDYCVPVSSPSAPECSTIPLHADVQACKVICRHLSDPVRAGTGKSVTAESLSDLRPMDLLGVLVKERLTDTRFRKKLLTVLRPWYTSRVIPSHRRF